MEIYYSKSKLAKGFLLVLVLTAAALFVSSKVIDGFFAAQRSVLSSVSFYDVFEVVLAAVSIFGVLICGGGMVVLTQRLFRSDPQVIFDMGGIEDKRLNTGLIEWNKIAYISLADNNYAQWLNLTLHSPDKYFGQLPKFQLLLCKLNGQTGKNYFRIRFSDLNVPIDDAWQYIEENVIKPREEKSIALML